MHFSPASAQHAAACSGNLKQRPVRQNRPLAHSGAFFEHNDRRSSIPRWYGNYTWRLLESLVLRCDQRVCAQGREGQFSRISHLYIEPGSYELDKKTGDFPEGTIFFKELQRSRRPGYQNFNHHDPKAQTAKLHPSSECAFCHMASAKKDDVLTQYRLLDK
ncbi:hypothetical protein AB4853_40650 [Bradyrhizobium sp. 1050_B9_N1_2]|uniref:hypothetical protein n=1 Tax=Bradyrhizobium sp. 1050_B9_N1_2 TaxID=3238688 RepID=UPI003EDC8DF3